MSEKKNDTKIEKHEAEPAAGKHAKVEKMDTDKVIVKPITINKGCFGPKTKVTPPATIGALWPDHPWIVMKPEYENHIFHEIPNCPYPKHTVLLDEANGIKFMKYIGDVAMNAQGFIQGLFWVATAIEDQAAPPVTPLPPESQTVSVPVDSAAILALGTQPKVLATPPAGASLVLQSATGALTFGTVPYVDAGGVAILQIRCGTAPVSADVPASAITGSSSADIMFTALPGQTVQPDQPLTLALINGALTGGDSTVALDVTYTVHPPAV
jgi:hypothetical protein